MANTEKHWAYELIKQSAEQQEISDEDFEVLKQSLAADIDSVRRSDQIKNIRDLLDCLERRDVINNENVEPIRIVAEHAKSERLEEMLDTYPLPKQQTLLYNVYNEQRLAESLQMQLNLKNTSQLNMRNQSNASLVYPVMSQNPMKLVLTSEQRAAIYKRIVKTIGRNWRQLGRELELTEGSLDEIEMQFPRDLSSRMYAVFKYFEEDDCNDPKEHFNILCRALDACQRKDIRRKLQEMMRI